MTREERARELLTAAGFPENASARAAANYETVIAHMVAFADAEAAAMRERAAGVVEAAVAKTQRGAIQAMRPYYTGPEQARVDMGCDLMAAIRSLPATGEVGR